MTPQELSEIDRQVAEAIDLEVFWTRSRHNPESTKPREPHWYERKIPGKPLGEDSIPFRPSTDWNDAMFAAEKAGLEDLRLTKTTGGYELVVFNERGDARMHSNAETGPLAICNAILHLKGKE